MFDTMFIVECLIRCIELQITLKGCTLTLFSENRSDSANNKVDRFLRYSNLQIIQLVLAWSKRLTNQERRKAEIFSEYVKMLYCCEKNPFAVKEKLITFEGRGGLNSVPAVSRNCHT